MLLNCEQQYIILIAFKVFHVKLCYDIACILGLLIHWLFHPCLVSLYECHSLSWVEIQSSVLCSCGFTGYSKSTNIDCALDQIWQRMSFGPHIKWEVYRENSCPGFKRIKIPCFVVRPANTSLFSLNPLSPGKMSLPFPQSNLEQMAQKAEEVSMQPLLQSLCFVLCMLQNMHDLLCLVLFFNIKLSINYLVFPIAWQLNWNFEAVLFSQQEVRDNFLRCGRSCLYLCLLKSSLLMQPKINYNGYALCYLILGSAQL